MKRIDASGPLLGYDTAHRLPNYFEIKCFLTRLTDERSSPKYADYVPNESAGTAIETVEEAGGDFHYRKTVPFEFFEQAFNYF